MTHVGAGDTWKQDTCREQDTLRSRTHVGNMTYSGAGHTGEQDTFGSGTHAGNMTHVGNWTHAVRFLRWAPHLTHSILSWAHERIGSAVTLLAVAASNAKSAPQHPRLSYSRGHQCPLEGSAGHRHSLVFLTQVVGSGEMRLCLSRFSGVSRVQESPEKHWWEPSTRIVRSCSEEGAGPSCGTAWHTSSAPARPQTATSEAPLARVNTAL